MWIGAAWWKKQKKDQMENFFDSTTTFLNFKFLKFLKKGSDLKLSLQQWSFPLCGSTIGWLNEAGVHTKPDLKLGNWGWPERTRAGKVWEHWVGKGSNLRCCVLARIKKLASQFVVAICGLVGPVQEEPFVWSSIWWGSCCSIMRQNSSRFVENKKIVSESLFITRLTGFAN